MFDLKKILEDPFNRKPAPIKSTSKVASTAQPAIDTRPYPMRVPGTAPAAQKPITQKPITQSWITPFGDESTIAKQKAAFDNKELIKKQEKERYTQSLNESKRLPLNAFSGETGESLLNKYNNTDLHSQRDQLSRYQSLLRDNQDRNDAEGMYNEGQTSYLLSLIEDQGQKKKGNLGTGVTDFVSGMLSQFTERPRDLARTIAAGTGENLKAAEILGNEADAIFNLAIRQKQLGQISEEEFNHQIAYSEQQRALGKRMIDRDLYYGDPARAAGNVAGTALLPFSTAAGVGAAGKAGMAGLSKIYGATAGKALPGVMASNPTQLLTRIAPNLGPRALGVGGAALENVMVNAPQALLDTASERGSQATLGDYAGSQAMSALTSAAFPIGMGAVGAGLRQVGKATTKLVNAIPTGRAGEAGHHIIPFQHPELTQLNRTQKELTVKRGELLKQGYSPNSSQVKQNDKAFKFVTEEKVRVQARIRKDDQGGFAKIPLNKKLADFASRNVVDETSAPIVGKQLGKETPQFDTLPSDINPSLEAKAVGAKRIAPDRIMHQQITPDSAISTIKNESLSLANKLQEYVDKSRGGRITVDSTTYNKIKDFFDGKVPKGKTTDIINRLSNMSDNDVKNIYVGLIKKDISRGYKYPDAVLDFDQSFKTAVDSRARYEKGLATSFSADDSRIVFDEQNRLVAGMKRQDGKQLLPEQKQEIIDGVTQTQNALGIDLNKMSKDERWVYAHLNGKNPFLTRSASGLYRKASDSVSISLGGTESFDVVVDGKKVSKKVNTTMAHELGHALDYNQGQKVLDSSTIYDLIYNYNPIEVSFRGPKYWSSRKEITARAIEQYVAVKEGHNDIYSQQGMWSKEIFDNKIKPAVEKAINDKFSEYKIQPSPTPTPQVTKTEVPKSVKIFTKSKFNPDSKGIYADYPVIRQDDNITLYQGSNPGEQRQYWTPNKKYAGQFGEVKEKTGSFYKIDNGNTMTDVYVEVPKKSTSAPQVTKTAKTNVNDLTISSKDPVYGHNGTAWKDYNARYEKGASLDNAKTQEQFNGLSEGTTKAFNDSRDDIMYKDVLTGSKKVASPDNLAYNPLYKKLAQTDGLEYKEVDGQVYIGRNMSDINKVISGELTPQEYYNLIGYKPERFAPQVTKTPTTVRLTTESIPSPRNPGRYYNPIREFPAKYYRIGELPDSKGSKNWNTGEREGGISVMKGYEDPETGRIILDGLENEHLELLHEGEKLYEVDGKFSGSWGSDGEDLLDIKGTKYVREIDAQNVVTDNNLHYNILGEDVSERPGFYDFPKPESTPAPQVTKTAEHREILGNLDKSKPTDTLNTKELKELGVTSQQFNTSRDIAKKAVDDIYNANSRTEVAKIHDIAQAKLGETIGDVGYLRKGVADAEVFRKQELVDSGVEPSGVNPTRKQVHPKLTASEQASRGQAEWKKRIAKAGLIEDKNGNLAKKTEVPALTPKKVEAELPIVGKRLTNASQKSVEPSVVPNTKAKPVVKPPKSQPKSSKKAQSFDPIIAEKARTEIDANLPSKYDNFERSIYGDTTSDVQGGTKGANAYQTEVRKGKEKYNQLIEKGLSSENNTVRRLSAGIRSLFGSAGDTATRTSKKGQMRGGIDESINLANDFKKLGDEMLPDVASRERVWAVLDPELATTKISEADLSPAEIKAVQTLRQASDLINDTNFSMNKISHETWLKGKDGKYITRAYEDYDLPPELADSRMLQPGKGKLDTGAYKARKDVDDWKQANAIKDPFYLASKRIQSTYRNKAITDYSNWINKQSDMISGTPRKGYTELSDSKMWGDLAGKSVRHDVLTDIKGFYSDSKALQGIYDGLNAYDRWNPRQALKMSKTILNPATRLGNQVWNRVGAAFNGINVAKFEWNMHKFAPQELAKNGKYARMLRKEGILSTDNTKYDLVMKLKEDGVEPGVIAKAIEKAKSSYGAADDKAKLSAFKYWLDKGKTVDEAIVKVRNGFQDYSKVGLLYDIGAKTPLVGKPFIRFQSELVRIIKNSVTENPLSFATVIGSIALIGELSSKASGETPEDKATREGRFGTPVVPFTQIPLVFQTPIGEVNVARMFGMYETAGADTKNKNIIQRASKYLPFDIPTSKEDLIKMTGNDVLTGGIANQITDTDFRGKSISDPDSNKYQESTLTPAEKLANRAGAAYHNYQLPIVNDVENLGRSVLGLKDQYGRVKTPLQAGSKLTGFKVEQFGPEEAKAQREKDAVYADYDKKDLQKQVNSVLKQQAEGKIDANTAKARIDNLNKSKGAETKTQNDKVFSNPNGGFSYLDDNGSLQTKKTEALANLEIAKMDFKSSDELILESGDKVFIKDEDGEVKSVKNLKSAKLEIAKRDFKKSDKNIDMFDDNILRKDKNGEVQVTTKNDYDYQLGEAKLSKFKRSDNLNGWMDQANKQLDLLDKQLKDPNVDELDKIDLENKADALIENMKKYAGYGAFTKGKGGTRMDYAKGLEASLTDSVKNQNAVRNLLKGINIKRRKI